jgi:integrase
MAERGTPLRVVHSICGHSQLTTTQRYTHVRDRARRDAVTALGEAVKTRREALDERDESVADQPMP